MTGEEAIKALRLMEHVESIVSTYEPGEIRLDTTVRELKEACRMGAAALRAEQQTNAPLTLDELREMDGEPVYIESQKYGNGWCIVDWHGVNKSWLYFSRTGTAEGMTATPLSARDYGVTWLAYRRKPEEGNRK